MQLNFLKIFISLFLCTLCMTAWGEGPLRVGVGIRDITPPIGTPSAGYVERGASGMKGVHDPLHATAVVIDNGEQLVSFCSVDHLGFLYDMTQEVIERIHEQPGLSECALYIGSTHTHAGGGAYCNIPTIGEMIAGPYNAEIRQFYIEAVVAAIVEAQHNLQEAKIGIGSGKGPQLTYYTGIWPKECSTPSDISLIKMTKPDGQPLALLYNYAINPAVLRATNELFSADLIGSAKTHLQAQIGNEVPVLFFNGAIGDLETISPRAADHFIVCDALGNSLANAVSDLWKSIETKEQLTITQYKDAYSFAVKPTPTGFQPPIDIYSTEINLIVLNDVEAFVTIPAELSCTYEPIFKLRATELGYHSLSILGLVNDAHGYIFSPEAWRLKPRGSHFAFGGELYGEVVKEKVMMLMEEGSPIKR